MLFRMVSEETTFLKKNQSIKKILITDCNS